MARGRRPKYGPEFKAEAIRLARTSTDSMREARHPKNATAFFAKYGE